MSTLMGKRGSKGNSKKTSSNSGADLFFPLGPGELGGQSAPVRCIALSKALSSGMKNFKKINLNAETQRYRCFLWGTSAEIAEFCTSTLPTVRIGSESDTVYIQVIGSIPTAGKQYQAALAKHISSLLGISITYDFGASQVGKAIMEAVEGAEGTFEELANEIQQIKNNFEDGLGDIADLAENGNPFSGASNSVSNDGLGSSSSSSSSGFGAFSESSSSSYDFSLSGGSNEARTGVMKGARILFDAGVNQNKLMKMKGLYTSVSNEIEPAKEVAVDEGLSDEEIADFIGFEEAESISNDLGFSQVNTKNKSHQFSDIGFVKKMRLKMSSNKVTKKACGGSPIHVYIRAGRAEKVETARLGFQTFTYNAGTFLTLRDLWTVVKSVI